MFSRSCCHQLTPEFVTPCRRGVVCYRGNFEHEPPVKIGRCLTHGPRKVPALCERAGQCGPNSALYHSRFIDNVFRLLAAAHGLLIRLQ
jgi:hypothetical protein